MLNLSAWYHGRYVQQAVGSCFSEKCEYPDKPFELTANKEKPKEITDKPVNADALRFSAWSKAFNQNFIQQHPENQ